jgi:hypothetical protein
MTRRICTEPSVQSQYQSIRAPPPRFCKETSHDTSRFPLPVLNPRCDRC